MEHILKHNFPGIDLSTPGLRQRAQATMAEDASDRGSIEDSSNQGEADLAIDEEKYTIDPVDKNITRECLPVSDEDNKC
jgi:hypothetical protein